MAVLELEFDSRALKRMVTFQAVIPYERFEPPYPTVYLLRFLARTGSWQGPCRKPEPRQLLKNGRGATILPSAMKTCRIYSGGWM